MKKATKEIIGHNFLLRLISADDKEAYYNAGFKVMDEQIRYFTQSEHVYSHKQIVDYVDRVVEDENRYDFLIVNSQNQICGESVLNEINWSSRCANFRIALFDHENFGKGIGSAAVKLTIKFGFEELQLNRIELEVYGFNERAIRTYQNAGFQLDFVQKDMRLLDGNAGEICTMSISKEQFLNLN